MSRPDPADDELRSDAVRRTRLPPKSGDLGDWYRDVVRHAELADDAPVAGCMVIRPYGFALWEKIKALLDSELQATGHRNACFPLLIPEGLLEKEAEHVEGFAPEAAWVTVGGDEELDERLAVRPTSEAIVCSLFADWIRTWRDLPVLINQWVNVVRWQEKTIPFLDTTEYLWQEGHTAHATAAGAEEEVRRIIEIYREFMEDDLALPVTVGRKSPHARFAGAIRSYAADALLADGRILEVGTAHELGQNFSRAFDIRFQDRDGERHHVWQTSWGVTTRLIAATIVAHGDDDGLILPPRVAPLQIVVVPLPGEAYTEEVLPEARRLERILSTAGLRARLDDREGLPPGRKFREWALRGVPVRVEIGPRDVAADQAILVRRDDRDRTPVPVDHVPAQAAGLLDSIQHALLDRARDFLRSSTHRVGEFDRFRELAERRPGILEAGWCGDRGCAEEIRDATGTEIRSPIESAESPDACIRCGRPATEVARFAEPY